MLAAITFLVGIVLGALGAWLYVSRRSPADAVQPLAESMERLERQLRDLERASLESRGGVDKQLEIITRETLALSGALRAPQVRGRWGELTLRRVAELSGMVKFCDFDEQSSQGSQRPDMIVRLAGGRTIAVDAKTPLTAFVEAGAAASDQARKAALARHANLVARHAAHLASKQYWAQLQPSPEMVILFLPGDHFLAAALEAQPDLIETALEGRVLLATPLTLISVLKGVAFGWRQERLTENGHQIRQTAREFLDRLNTFSSHFLDTGTQLNRAVDAYNRSVASWESRLSPALRRMHELGAGGEPREPKPVDNRAARAAAAASDAPAPPDIRIVS